MTERPILFSAPMVRALLDGRKTQTRRILTRNNVEVLGASWRGKSHPWQGLRFAEAVARENSPISGTRDPHLAVPFCHPDDEPMPTAECGVYRVHPVIQPGDRLFVREAFSGLLRHDAVPRLGRPAAPPRSWSPNDPIWYWADGNPTEGDWTKPKPGIHMPRWASRLTLTVTDVRVERLQDISEGDCIAEGAFVATPRGHDHGQIFVHRDPAVTWQTMTPRAWYHELWDTINGAGIWDANHWVVAVTFTVERRNIDSAPPSQNQRQADVPPEPTLSSAGAK